MSSGAQAHPAGKVSVAWTSDVGPCDENQDCAVFRVHNDGSWRGRSLCPPHRSHGDFGYLTKYLGAPFSWPEDPDRRLRRMTLLTDNEIELPRAPHALVILSDGAWEPIVSPAIQRGVKVADLLTSALASLMDPDATNAQAIAERIMRASRIAGLDGNATIAVAHVDAVTACEEKQR